MARYRVNDIFSSVQGEGAETGKYCTFIRLSGCNMSCVFCDTDFKKYKIMTAEQIVERIDSPNIVITGGEPLLQDLMPLVKILRDQKSGVTVETNGTLRVPSFINHYCSISLSPKVPVNKCKVKKCISLKIIYPYMSNIRAQDFLKFPAKYRSLQVVDPEANKPMILSAIQELKRLPPYWRLGIQLHKMIGVR